jgi:SWI/SNF-related matrix-associated actin-dependent regulator of chromatin subfamily A-like protein 1
LSQVGYKLPYMETLTPSQIETLRGGIRLLAGLDGDFARTENGVGFAKNDVGTGHMLAKTPDVAWTEAVIVGAAQIAVRYMNTQLGHFDTETAEAIRKVASRAGRVERDEIKQATRTATKETKSGRTIKFEGGQFVIRFPYDSALVALVKNEVESRRWDGVAKVWACGKPGIPGLRTLVADHGFVADEATLEAFGGPVEVSYGVECGSGTFTIKLTLPAMNGALDQVRAIPGRSWNPAISRWIVPASEWVAVKRLADAWAMTVAPCVNWSEMESDSAQALAAATAMSADPFPIPYMRPTCVPRPYQWAGIKYMTDKRRAIQADDMGTGKTLQSVLSFCYNDQWPVLVVCPQSVKRSVWYNEIRKWSTRNAYVIDGTTGHIPNGFDFYIINYHLLSPRVDQLADFGFKGVVWDESKAIKENTAAMTKASKKIAKKIPKDGLRFVLNGTPVSNRPYELISQLQVIDQLEALGGSRDFMYKYCGGTKGGSAGPRALAQLNTILLKTCMVRRTKDQVLADLPALSVNQMPFDVTGWAEYEKAEADIVEYIRNRAFEIAKAVAGLSDEEAIKEARRKALAAQRAETLVRIGALRQLAARLRKPAMKTWVKEIIDGGKKVIVFAHHREITVDFAKEFNAPYIIGGQTSQARADAVQKFQEDDSCKVIVVAISAGGVGLTLTAADTILFAEQAWSPSDMAQAWSRAHRMGQENPVNAYIAMTPTESIDHYLAEILEAKKEITDAIHDGRVIENADDEASVISALIDKLGSL